MTGRTTRYDKQQVIIPSMCMMTIIIKKPKNPPKFFFTTLKLVVIAVHASRFENTIRTGAKMKNMENNMKVSIRIPKYMKNKNAPKSSSGAMSTMMNPGIIKRKKGTKKMRNISKL